jgi:hypothetical protein
MELEAKEALLRETESRWQKRLQEIQNPARGSEEVVVQV